MAKEGTGRNRIARLLNGQGFHISEGSVGNIIREYRRQGSLASDIKSPEAQHPHPTQQYQVNTSTNNAYTADDNTIDLTGSPSSITAASPPHEASSPPLGDGLKPASKNKNSGAPLSFFIGSTTAAASSTTVITAEDFFRASLVNNNY
jgi:hypothetical protein